MAKALSRMVKAVTYADLRRDFKVCESAPPISILQFANDTLIFCGVSEDQIMNVKATLICFKAMSGLLINFCKSELIGIRVEVDLVHHYAKILGCKVGHLPTSYLGLSLC